VFLQREGLVYRKYLINIFKSYINSANWCFMSAHLMSHIRLGIKMWAGLTCCTVSNQNHRHKHEFLSFQIYSNGYVTFGLAFKSRYPDNLVKEMLSTDKLKNAKKQGFAIIAPLWTDNDASNGRVSYQIYDENKLNQRSTPQERARVKVCIIKRNKTCEYIYICT